MITGGWEDKRITIEEVRELFGDALPMVAVHLLNNPGAHTVEQVRARLRCMADRNLPHAKALYDRACWEFMDSVRKGRRNDAWFDLANAIFLLWPEVDPDATAPAIGAIQSKT